MMFKKIYELWGLKEGESPGQRLVEVNFTGGQGS
jgi:hypothetical protein